MEMLKYILRRLVLLIPVIIGVMLIVFFFQSISGDDPALAILGAGSSVEDREAKREELGLNDPIAVQFGRYVWNFFTRGDLGDSYETGQPVTKEIFNRFPITIQLALIAVFFGVILGVPLGIWSAIRQNKPIDNAIVTFSVFLESVPNFWLALLLITFFSLRLHLLPSIFNRTFAGWVLPSITVIVGSLSMIIRVTRSSMLETIRQDYVRTARAKGQTEFKVILRHVLRNSLIPIVNSIGNSLGLLLGGALIVETIFGMPGIGKYTIDAVSARNYPSVLGSVVILAITFSLINLLVDLTYIIVNPSLKVSIIKKQQSRKQMRRMLKEGD